MNGLNVCVIGGGSTYTPELIEGFADRESGLPVGRLTLMDIDPARLEVVGGLAQRMLEAAESDIELRLATDRSEALAEADYVLTQIRVGGMSARIRDERIPLKYGVVGQETTGPGGFAKALRTIPVMLDVAADMRRVAPSARLINFTNPSGLITQAIWTYTDVKTIGLCNSPVGAQSAIAELLSVDPARIRLDWVGLNHLSWVRGVHLDGRDVIDDVIEKAIAGDLLPPFSPELLRALRMLPNDYLDYYYNTDRVVREQQAAEKTRGEIVLEVERDLLRMYEDPTLTTKPEELEQRGGAHYSGAAVGLIRALESDVGETQIVDTPNRGAISGLPDDAVIEIPCVIDRRGVQPIPGAPLPASIRGLVQSVKAYEELAIVAGAEGDERSAILALTVHPLIPSFDVAKRLWEEIKQANAAQLPQFG
jgi:6-phospho-beta-glucosidase